MAEQIANYKPYDFSTDEIKPKKKIVFKVEWEETQLKSSIKPGVIKPTANVDAAISVAAAATSVAIVPSPTSDKKKKKNKNKK